MLIHESFPLDASAGVTVVPVALIQRARNGIESQHRSVSIHARIGSDDQSLWRRGGRVFS